MSSSRLLQAAFSGAIGFLFLFATTTADAARGPCGDGILGPGETCDVGHPCSFGSNCVACQCQHGSCGDRYLDLDEECDPPGSFCPNFDTCNSICRCGDPPPGAGEEVVVPEFNGRSYAVIGQTRVSPFDNLQVFPPMWEVKNKVDSDKVEGEINYGPYAFKYEVSPEDDLFTEAEAKQEGPGVEHRSESSVPGSYARIATNFDHVLVLASVNFIDGAAYLLTQVLEPIDCVAPFGPSGPGDFVSIGTGSNFALSIVKQTCGSSFPQCNGPCPNPGDACLNFGDACLCTAAPACEDSGWPTCHGDCPSGDECVALSSGPCACIPGVCE